ncbi:MlaD family protein [Croceibacter atlanticus]|uniref:MlaD family protein n=1 Tax=Croceibacter atlanticus TaxID=313588 RepID=UPI000C91EA3B|nr:ABC transporter substrate-binding protein [Croceibacter sp.]WSP34246.1 MlaD family protein [Croceibacter atlanticus]HAT69038.1 MCE family protein [Flavobacteriaceae bacterium]
MKITREVKTAVLVLSAIALLIFGYYFLKGNNLLDGSRTFYAVYDDVEGLARSSKVTINGLQVGKVTDIQIIDSRGNLAITFTVENDFEFSKNSIARIYGGGIIGGKSLAIVPTYEQGQMAKDGDTLKSEIEEGLLELVNDRLTPLQKKIENVIVSVDSLVNGFNEILDPNTRQNLRNSFASLDRTMASLENTSGTLNGILTDNKPKLDRTFTNLDEMSYNFNSFSDSLAEVNLAGIVNDFEEIAADLKNVAAKANSTDGTVGKLLNDPKVYDNLDRATKQLEQLLQDVKLNPKRYVHISVFGKRNKDYKPPKDSLK